MADQLKRLIVAALVLFIFGSGLEESRIGAAPIPKDKTCSPLHILGLANTSVKDAGPNYTMVYTARVALEYSRFGDTDSAKRLFSAVLKNEQLRDPKYEFVGDYMGRAGFIDDAVKLQRSADPDSATHADKVRANWAGWLYGSGDLKTLAKLVEESTDKDACLLALIREQCRLGKIGAAQKSIGAMKAPPQLVRGWVIIGLAQQKAKDAEGAAESLKQALKCKGIAPGRQDWLAQLILPLSIATGDWKIARELAEKTKEAGPREYAFAEIGFGEIATGKVEAGIETLDALGNGYYPGRSRKNAVVHFAAKGEWKNAETMIASIKCIYWKVQAQRQLAVEYSKAGKAIESAKALALADEFAGPNGENVQDSELGWGDRRSDSIQLRYRTLVELGRVNEAVEQASKLTDAKLATQVFLTIVRAMRPRLYDDQE